MYRKIIVCVDETSQSERVARVGADMACRYDAEVVLVSVLDAATASDQPYTGLEAVELRDRHSRSLSSRVHRMAAMLRDRGVRSHQMLLQGPVAETILEVAQTESADLIVVGGGVQRRFLAWLRKDLWSEIAHKATCHVLRVMPARCGEKKEDDGTQAPTAREKNLLAVSLSAL